MAYYEKNLKRFTKGELGEGIVKEWLESKGYISFKPDGGGRHKFDKIAISPTGNVVMMDVKTKPRRIKDKMTGVDVAHLDTYKQFEKLTGNDFLLVFVDEIEKCAYGEWISRLPTPEVEEYYCKRRGKYVDVAYWDLNTFRHLFHLKEETVNKIKESSDRNQKYEYA